MEENIKTFILFFDRYRNAEPLGEYTPGHVRSWASACHPPGLPPHSPNKFGGAVANGPRD